MLHNAIEQVRACPYVSRVWVASDNDAVLRHARQHCYILKRPEVGPDESSFDSLRWVQERLGLEASYMLLCQATSPFINPDDLSNLVMEWTLHPSLPGALLIDPQTGSPSGMGYIISPFASSCHDGIYVPQNAPPHDIDTLADYERACQEWKKRYGEVEDTQ